MLIGIALDDMLEGEEPTAPGGRLLYLVGTFAGLLLLLAGVARMLPGSLFGTKDSADTGSIPLGVFMAVAGAALVYGFIRAYGRKPIAASTVKEAAPVDLRRTTSG